MSSSPEGAYSETLEARVEQLEEVLREAMDTIEQRGGQYEVRETLLYVRTILRAAL